MLQRATDTVGDRMPADERYVRDGCGGMRNASSFGTALSVPHAFLRRAHSAPTAVPTQTTSSGESERSVTVMYTSDIELASVHTTQARSQLYSLYTYMYSQLFEFCYLYVYLCIQLYSASPESVVRRTVM